MNPIQTGSRVESSHLDELAVWETAAKMLDLDPGFVPRLRQPKLEVTCREFETIPQAVTVFIAANEIRGTECTAFLGLGPDISREGTEKRFWDVCTGSILTSRDRDCAAVGIRVPENISERELWMLSREVAPVLTRVLGAAAICPSDLKSSVFAGWMAHAPFSSGERIEASRLEPQRYWDRRERRLASAIVYWCALALEERHKRLRGCTAIALGCSARMNAVVRGLVEEGLKVIGMADNSGGLLTGEYVDVQQLLAHLEADGLVAEFADGRHVLASSVAQLSCDLVLVEPRMCAALDVARTGTTPIIIELNNHECAASMYGGEILALPAIYMDCLGLLPEFDNGVTNEDALMHALQAHVKSLWTELRAICTRFAVENRSATLLLILQRLAERERLRHP